MEELEQWNNKQLLVREPLSKQEHFEGTAVSLVAPREQKSVAVDDQLYSVETDVFHYQSGLVVDMGDWRSLGNFQYKKRMMMW